MTFGVPVAAPELRAVDIDDLALNTTMYYAVCPMWPLTSDCQARFLVGLHLDRGRGIVESTAYPMSGILTLLVIVAAIFLMYGLMFPTVCLYLTLSAPVAARDSATDL